MDRRSAQRSLLCFAQCFEVENGEKKMEEIADYIGSFAAGVLFCLAVWILFLQCDGLLFKSAEEMLREFEVMYVR